jgi:hypothetical protein
MEDLDEITLDKQTLIHIAGMPFWLPEGTVIYGRIGNFELAIKEMEERSREILAMHKINNDTIRKIHDGHSAFIGESERVEDGNS